jgi:transcription elongation factor GreA
MGEQPLEPLLAEIVAGTVDVSEIPLAQAADAAEALADEGQVAILCAHAERVLPRLVKKDRIEVIEAIWLACCTSGALPVDVLIRTADRLTARGHQTAVVDLIVMLADTLTDTGKVKEALEVLRQGLVWTPASELIEQSKVSLAAMYDTSPNLDRVLADLGPATSPEAAVAAFDRANRALRFHPGTFLQQPDLTVCQVIAVDGDTAKVKHPSGAFDSWPVNIEPPPKLLHAEAHDVLRLFEPEELHTRWLNDPSSTLITLLHEHQGVMNSTSLRSILAPSILSEVEADEVLERLRSDCVEDVPERPAYESRRRLFIAPGYKAPRPKTKAPKKPHIEDDEHSHRLTRVSRPGVFRAASPQAVAEEPTTPTGPVRWINLTVKPEIKGLIHHIENEIGELTREMNADLPKKLEEARAHGDLRENAEYDAAKERLRLVQSRIEQLHGRLAKVHELSHVRVVPGKITTMSIVVVADEGTGAERTLRLVPPELPAPKLGDVSIGTPYAKALVGKEVGGLAVVRLPRRTERLEIIKVVDPDDEGS